MTYSYLKRILGYVEYDFKLEEEIYDIGTTFEDYDQGKWILLNEEQLEFRRLYPGATAKEIIEMKLNVPPVVEPDVESIRKKVLKDLEDYDLSPFVNSFKLNGMDVWLDKATRVGLMNSTQIEKAAGHKETTLWLGTISLTINCDLAIQMLSALELYALDCFNKTAEHRSNIMALETIEELMAYNFKTGYPDKLNLSTKTGVEE